MYKIEKGIPFNGSLPAGSGRRVYPFHFMGIGESFLVPFDMAKNAYGAARVYKARTAPNGWAFARQQEADGVRFFRTA